MGAKQLLLRLPKRRLTPLGAGLQSPKAGLPEERRVLGSGRNAGWCLTKQQK